MFFSFLLCFLRVFKDFTITKLDIKRALARKKFLIIGMKFCSMAKLPVNKIDKYCSVKMYLKKKKIGVICCLDYNLNLKKLFYTHAKKVPFSSKLVIMLRITNV